MGVTSVCFSKKKQWGRGVEFAEYFRSSKLFIDYVCFFYKKTSLREKLDSGKKVVVLLEKRIFSF